MCIYVCYVCLDLLINVLFYLGSSSKYPLHDPCECSLPIWTEPWGPDMRNGFLGDTLILTFGGSTGIMIVGLVGVVQVVGDQVDLVDFAVVVV